MFEEKDYAYTLKVGKLYERIKSILTWDSEKNAWLIPSEGKVDAMLKVIKYKSKPTQLLYD